MPRSLITLAIAPRHFSVVSGVSVNTLALNAVTPCVAVRVHVDEPRHKAQAVRLNDARFPVGQVFADLRDQRVHAKHVGAHELPVLINARILNQELIHGDVLPS